MLLDGAYGAGTLLPDHLHDPEFELGQSGFVGGLQFGILLSC